MVEIEITKARIGFALSVVAFSIFGLGYAVGYLVFGR